MKVGVYFGSGGGRGGRDTARGDMLANTNNLFKFCQNKFCIIEILRENFFKIKEEVYYTHYQKSVIKEKYMFLKLINNNLGIKTHTLNSLGIKFFF